ncbi:MAG: hypothetical protein V7L22_03660 [Nostoc sp.]|uniref:hypothetical protein n=1 Tax=Nostoc sp. TaxID=1180 RepID=UPI002FF6CA46
MNWVEVNNIVLSNSWQLLTQSLVEGNLFRVSQTWDIYPQGAKALIAQSLTNEHFEFYKVKSFYPSDDVKILDLTIPTDLISAGFTSRYLVMKFYSRRQFTFNWNITVEKLIV